MRPSPSESSKMSFHHQQQTIEEQLAYISRNLFESNNDLEHSKRRRKTLSNPTTASSTKVIWRPYLDSNNLISAAEQSKENINNNNNNVIHGEGIKRKCISSPTHAVDNSSPPKLHKFYEQHNAFAAPPGAVFRPIDYPDLEHMPSVAAAVPPPPRNYTHHHERFLLNNNYRRTPDLLEGGRLTPETCSSRCSSSTDMNFSPSSSIGSTDDVIVSPKLKNRSYERGTPCLFHYFDFFFYWVGVGL